MSQFFSLEGSFYKYGGMLADIMILSLIWLVISSPFLFVSFTWMSAFLASEVPFAEIPLGIDIILIFAVSLPLVGVATTSMYYVTTRRIANREGYIFRDFFSSFKSNFKKVSLLTLTVFAVYLILFINVTRIEAVGSLSVIILPFQICFLIELTLITFYVFPLAARFDMKVRQIFKSAFYMANRHLLTSITLAVLFVAIVLGLNFYPVMFIVAPGLYVWLSSYMLMRIFKKYRPEMDKDPMQEIAEIEAAIAASKDTVEEHHRVETARMEAAGAKEEMEQELQNEQDA